MTTRKMTLRELKSVVKKMINEGSTDNFSDVHRTILFVFNLPTDFIERIWADTPELIEPLKKRFDMVDRAGGLSSAFFNFYNELSYNEQKMVESYIRTHYDI